jgi:bifunctional N-acetylglucosamine-1-phosphate-uridyltransferase/glucosamine-1-phosphate-acetyltransferase GlmU-like protein
MQWGTPADLADYEYWAGVYASHRARRRDGSARRPLQLLMPMAGSGSRFGPGQPKFLRTIFGLDQPMFRAAIDHLPACDSRVLVVREEHAESVKGLAPSARLVRLTEPTEGQAVTCALACEALQSGVPVLVSSCDHGLVWDEERWQALLDEDPDVIVWGQRGYPGADVTPNAFAYIDAEDGRVRRVSVKQPLGADPRRDLLLVGTFYFKRPALLAHLIAELRAKDIRVNGELYLDSVVNLAVARGLAVRAFEAEGYFCWGTPEALREFNFWHAWYSGHAAPPGPRAESLQP